MRSLAVLLVEQVDCLSRLTSADWEKLKAELTARRVRVVALDLPTSWMMATSNTDEFTGRMFEAINGMLLDMLAAVAARTTTIGVDVRRRGKPRQRLRAAIRAVRRIPSAMPASLAYWRKAARGASFRT